MRSLTIFTFFLLFVSCSASPQRDTVTSPVSHEIWDDLLKKYVDAAGRVDYQGCITDKDKLQSYLDLLSSNAPDKKTWSDQERLAYWINAYNAFTVKLIIDNYPVESIRDLNPTVTIPGISTVWHKRFFKIGGVETSLDEIEHSILRKEFNEPRIHFAINCASFSCPLLRAEAFVAEKIDQQLEEQAVGFINDTKRNKISNDKVEISRIFGWFTRDFTKEGSLIDFLNRYANVKIDDDADIDYLDYDWSLNDIE